MQKAGEDEVIIERAHERKPNKEKPEMIYQ